MSFSLAARIAIFFAIVLAGVVGHFGWSLGWLIVPFLLASGLRMASKAGSRTVEILENPILQLDAAHLLIMFHGAIVALLMAPAFLTAKWLG